MLLHYIDFLFCVGLYYFFREIFILLFILYFFPFKHLLAWDSNFFAGRKNDIQEEINHHLSGPFRRSFTSLDSRETWIWRFQSKNHFGQDFRNAELAFRQSYCLLRGSRREKELTTIGLYRFSEDVSTERYWVHENVRNDYSRNVNKPNPYTTLETLLELNLNYGRKATLLTRSVFLELECKHSSLTLCQEMWSLITIWQYFRGNISEFHCIQFVFG